MRVGSDDVSGPRKVRESGPGPERVGRFPEGHLPFPLGDEFEDEEGKVRSINQVIDPAVLESTADDDDAAAMTGREVEVVVTRRSDLPADERRGVREMVRLRSMRHGTLSTLRPMSESSFISKSSFFSLS